MFDSVPFHVGSVHLATGDPAFVEAQATDIALLDVQPFLSSAEVTVIGLTPVASPSLPADIAILANHTLLDGAIPNVGISDGVYPRAWFTSSPDDLAGEVPVARTWVTVCDPAANDPLCEPDVDADGYDDDRDGDPATYDGSDCMPTWSGHHPFRTDITDPSKLPWDASAPDRNCDGWLGTILVP